ncbi:MAG: protein kinase [Myxococcota bacterium]|nr:protein kinase [Myxococcota bacterium]
MSQRDEVATVPDPDAQRGSLPPLSLSRYDIGARIGRGGMGEVFLARDIPIGREVAIKRMRSPNASERSVARFVREARIQARLDHPAIVPVHELGLDPQGLPYIVMKHLSGLTMRAVLGRDVPPQRLLRAFVDVCFAVEYAHARGVVHRDLKPENIMLGDFGEVYVLDWGVAQVLGNDNIDAGHDGAGEDEAGAVIGTPEYMAPEQGRGDVVDARADVYSLGRILFELLTGSDAAMQRPSQLAPDVPVELDELCAHALVEDREHRLASAHELAFGVQAYLDGDRDLERRRELAGKHATNARDALVASSGDEAHHRSIAMREAGRALALDPTRTEAADLISKLMLEPPAQVPHDVERELEEERMSLLRRNASAASTSMFAVIAMALLIWATTGAHGADIAAIGALGTAFLVLTTWARRARDLRRVVSVIAALGLTALVVLFARLYPPFVVAPVIASQLAFTTPFTMQHDQRWFSIYLTVLMIGAVIVPYLAESAGLLSATFTFRDDGVLLHTAALRGAEWMQIVIGTTYIALAVAFAGYLGFVTRRSERGARRQLRLQAWHLRQLVAR